jgi:hypothetical protein
MVDRYLRNDNLARKLAEDDIQHAVIARQSNPLSGRSSLHLRRMSIQTARPRCPFVAQMRSPDRVGQCPGSWVNRTYVGHAVSVAIDPEQNSAVAG